MRVTLGDLSGYYSAPERENTPRCKERGSPKARDKSKKAPHLETLKP